MKKFYVPDLIEDVVASKFWGSVWYNSNDESIWTGEKLELDYSIYDRFVKIGKNTFVLVDSTFKNN